MEESDTILANRTHALSNHACESSEGNAPASASWGRTEGPASDRAATRTVRSYGIALSGVRAHHVNAVQVELEGVPSLFIQGEGYAPEQVWTDALGKAPRRRGSSTVAGTGTQNREGPCSLGSYRNAAMPTVVVEHGLAHEAVVAMMPMITSGTSEGPLGCRGHGRHGVLGDCPQGLQRHNKQPSLAPCSEACGKPADEEGRPQVMETRGTSNRTGEISPSGMIEGARET